MKREGAAGERRTEEHLVGYESPCKFRGVLASVQKQNPAQDCGIGYVQDMSRQSVGAELPRHWVFIVSKIRRRNLCQRTLFVASYIVCWR